jgi:hypothetical protein
MLKQWYWALPLALMVTSPSRAGAQSIPVETFDPADRPLNAALPLADAASAPSFSQLSSTPVSKRTQASTTATAAAVPLDDDREARWLPLAGLAALAFVASRNRRAYRTGSSTGSA